MIEFVTTLPLVEQCLLALLLGVFLYQAYFAIRYLLIPRKYVVEKENKQQENTDAARSYPGVSVIVAARNEAVNLQSYLYRLLEQDYPEYEVIVINDGSEDGTQDVIDDYIVRYKHLRTTFVPRQARVKSTKKLALTLGIKAAKYDYLVFTDADCCVSSQQWLKAVMAGYEERSETEIVLGVGAYFTEKSALNRLIQYETLTSSLQYIGMAVAHRPYMGVGRNMSYRKELFVSNNGFSHFTGESAGDDDLFVNHAANKKNVSVAVRPESVTWSVPKKSWREWYQQRKRHLSVSHLYKTSSKLMLMFEPLTRGLLYALVIALLVVGTPIIKITALAVLLLRLVLLIGVLDISAHRIGVPKVGLETIVWDIVYPLLTLWILSLPMQNTDNWK